MGCLATNPSCRWGRAGRLWLIAGLACAIAGGWLLVAIFSRAPEREVPLRQLVQHDGRWYRPGQAAPFKGVLIDTYESGSLKARAAISDGLPDGVSEGWYTNGQRQVLEHFYRGLSHGLRTKWHENGLKQSEGMVVAGKLEGTFRRWNETGTLVEEIELKQGVPDGVSRAYYPSGFVRIEVCLRAGQVVERKTWEDGKHERRL